MTNFCLIITITYISIWKYYLDISCCFFFIWNHHFLHPGWNCVLKYQNILIWSCYKLLNQLSSIIDPSCWYLHPDLSHTDNNRIYVLEHHMTVVVKYPWHFFYLYLLLIHLKGCCFPCFPNQTNWLFHFMQLECYCQHTLARSNQLNTNWLPPLCNAMYIFNH